MNENILPLLRLAAGQRAIYWGCMSLLEKALEQAGLSDDPENNYQLSDRQTELLRIEVDALAAKADPGADTGWIGTDDVANLVEAIK